MGPLRRGDRRADVLLDEVPVEVAAREVPGRHRDGTKTGRWRCCPRPRARARSCDPTVDEHAVGAVLADGACAELAHQAVVRHGARGDEDESAACSVPSSRRMPRRPPVSSPMTSTAVSDSIAMPRPRTRPCRVGEVHSLGVERDLRRELPHQLRLVGVRRVRGDDGDASVAHLPSVAVGAQRGIAAPLLGEAGDVGKLVAQARGHEQPSCRVRFAGLEHDLEADGVGVERGRRDGRAGLDGDVVVARELGASGGERSSGEEWSWPSTPCMCAEKRLRGSPPSTTRTRRRERPSISAALRPALPPPTMMTSHSVRCMRQLVRRVR